MATIINNDKRRAVTVGGVTILPGQSAEVPTWDKAKGSKVVQSFLEDGLLSEGEAKADKTAAPAVKKA